MSATPNRDAVAGLAYAAHDRNLRAHLERDRDAALKILAAGDGIALHRAQGQYQYLVKLLETLDLAKNLR